MKISALISFCFIFAIRLHAADGASVVRKFLHQPDFIVRVTGDQIDKFNLGLSDYDSEGRLRPIRLPREGCVQFFADQKHKGSVVVWYYAADVDDWDQEIKRTVHFFQVAGYSRILLFQNYNLDSGITVIFDTSGEFKKLQYIPPEKSEN